MEYSRTEFLDYRKDAINMSDTLSALASGRHTSGNITNLGELTKKYVTSAAVEGVIEMQNQLFLEGNLTQREAVISSYNGYIFNEDFESSIFYKATSPVFGGLEEYLTEKTGEMENKGLGEMIEKVETITGKAIEGSIGEKMDILKKIANPETAIDAKDNYINSKINSLKIELEEKNLEAGIVNAIVNMYATGVNIIYGGIEGMQKMASELSKDYFENIEQNKEEVINYIVEAGKDVVGTPQRVEDVVNAFAKVNKLIEILENIN